MQIPEEFGDYLLLKKLAEDFLGETFRAGKVGPEGVEQVVLLRVLNGKGLDGEALWKRVAERAVVQQALRSPNIGNGVDLGRVRSYPYAAYDYISGKNLATLLAQASRQGSPIPTDHALLIAERISLALAVAHENRVAEERILHGFVVPHLVMISNEGETRLLGFEFASGLRELAAGSWRDAELAPYLAPEALASGAGGAIAKSDDVWSLGAILYELLTGERLPAAGPDGYGPVVDAAVCEYDGSAFPAPVAGLLKKSLMPREARIGDAVAWHKAVSKLMIEGHYSPTTFNLAFFMHNLFRDEIEREGQEIQAEKKLAVMPRPAAGAAATTAMPPALAGMAGMTAGGMAATGAARGTSRPGAPAGAVADMREKTGVREFTLPGTRVQAAQEAPSRTPLFAGIAAVVLVGAATAAYFLFFNSPAKPPAPPPTVALAQPAAPVPAAPPVGTEVEAADPAPDQIQAEIAAMFDARSKEMEDKLRGQYDQKIRELQRQLEDSRRPAAAQAVPAATRSIEPERPAVRTEPPAAQVASPPVPAPAVQNPPASAPVTATPQEAPPAPAAEPAVSEPPPVPAPVREPQVQVGDLVQPGPGVLRPQLAGLPEPRYPAAAKRMKKAAEVEIKVLVDERGRVVEAQKIGAKSGFGFDEAAMEAAQRASFKPATKNGVRVKMWATVRVTFKP